MAILDENKFEFERTMRSFQNFDKNKRIREILDSCAQLNLSELKEFSVHLEKKIEREEEKIEVMKLSDKVDKLFKKLNITRAPVLGE